MPTNAIVSYDDTLNDHDALMLGRVLAEAGARADARLRASHHADRARPRAARGARGPGAARARRAAGSGTSTSSAASSSAPRPARAWRWLAEQEHADMIVFGSDYRTAAGHVAPQHSAQALLEGGPAAIAIAPADYRTAPRTADQHDRGARRAGRRRGDRDGARARRGRSARIVTRDERNVDLLVVGSRSEAPAGRVMITARAQNAIEKATCPVLVVARGVPQYASPCRRRSAERRAPSQHRKLGEYGSALVRTLVISDLHLGGRLRPRRTDAADGACGPCSTRSTGRPAGLARRHRRADRRGPEHAMTVAEPVLRAMGERLGAEREK